MDTDKNMRNLYVNYRDFLKLVKNMTIVYIYRCGQYSCNKMWN